MDDGLKRRLIGATVLVSLVVIFVPMLLENAGQQGEAPQISNIPPLPDRPFTPSELPPEEGQPLSEPPTIVRLKPVEPAPPPVKPRYRVEAVPPKETGRRPATRPVPRKAPEATTRTRPPPHKAPPRAKPPANSKKQTPAPSREKPAPRKKAPARAVSAWVIQAGSFSSRANADKLVRQLRAKSFSAFVAQATVRGKLVFRVRIGPETSRREAEKTLARLNRKLGARGIHGTIRPYP